MKIEKDEVYTLKMGNGEEIVAKVVGETDTTFIIEKPATMVASADGSGVELIAALFSADHDKPVTVNKTQVAMLVLTKKVTSENYIMATTGIKPVSRKIVLG